ncbi:MAG: hypothetical protein IBX55_00415 [Methyloprofundus sp.]|nr:hypothetical protein [Methyloprofundus sp.]
MIYLNCMCCKQVDNGFGGGVTVERLKSVKVDAIRLSDFRSHKYEGRLVNQSDSPCTWSDGTTIWVGFRKKDNPGVNLPVLQGDSIVNV